MTDKTLIKKAYMTEEFETEETAAFLQSSWDANNPACYINPEKYYTEGWVCVANDRYRWQECRIFPNGLALHRLFRYTGNGSSKTIEYRRNLPNGATIAVYAFSFTGIRDNKELCDKMSDIAIDIQEKIEGNTWINPKDYRLSCRFDGKNMHVEIYL